MGRRNSDSIETEGNGTTAGAGSDSSTAGTGGVRGRSGRGTGGTAKAEAVVLEQDLVKTVTVDVPGKDKAAAVDKEEDKKAKARERQRAYREKKKANGTAPSTKKTSVAASKADATQLKILLLTISNVMATRPGMEMWQLTPAEVDSIAQPLSNMMAKNEAVTSALEEHGDALALITAIAMIAFPRVMTMMAQRKETPKIKHPAVEEVKDNATSKRGKPSESSNANATDGGSHDTSGGRSTGSRQVTGGSLHSIVPAIGFGY